MLLAFPEEPVGRKAFLDGLPVTWTRGAAEQAFLRLQDAQLIGRVSRGVYALTETGRATRAALRPGGPIKLEAGDRLTGSRAGFRKRPRVSVATLRPLDRALLRAFPDGPVEPLAAVQAVEDQQVRWDLQNAYRRLRIKGLIERRLLGVYALTAEGRAAREALRADLPG